MRPYSITSSARASNAGGTVRLNQLELHIAVAVLVGLSL